MCRRPKLKQPEAPPAAALAALLGLLLAAPPATPATAPAPEPPAPTPVSAPRPGVRHWAATALLRFAGSSTIHDFAGSVPAHPFTLVVSNHTWSATASVPAASMSTDNPKRDRRMHTMLDVATHPQIQGRVEAAPVPGPAGATALLHLTLGDRSVDLPVTVTDWVEGPDRLHFRASWDLSLRAFGLQPPSVAGLIRVADRVRLDAEVTAAPPPAPVP